MKIIIKDAVGEEVTLHCSISEYHIHGVQLWGIECAPACENVGQFHSG